MDTTTTTPLTSFQRASDILGDDFILPQEVASARGLTYSDEQLKYLDRTLPSNVVLAELRADDYLLVAGPPNEMSLLDVRDLNSQFFWSKLDCWYTNKKEKFAYHDKVGSDWLVIRKAQVPDSTRKTWSEQLELVKDTEQVPNAAEAVWGFTTYAEVRGTRLPSIYVRTSSVSSDGSRVFVGSFGDDGLGVSRWSDDSRHRSIGVVSARKF